MIETIITSSVLILIIAALRYLLREKVSSRLQYALWVLVAIRLLLPFSLFENPVSILNIMPAMQSFSEVSSPAVPANHEDTILPSGDSAALQNNIAISEDSALKGNKVDGKAIITSIWLCGVILSGAFFTASNIHFSRKLEKGKKQMEIPQCPLPVYMSGDIPSPCLYGIIRPAIYVTPESFSDEKRKEYVVAHELTHYYQKDHIWSFVRVLCLCIHWFNPLVWMAAILSRRDSELACDEGTLYRIGFRNRGEYGRALIEIMTSPPAALDIFCCATKMAGGKGEMAERIKRIAKQPKMPVITLAVVVVFAVAVAALTFGGAVKKVPAAAEGIYTENDGEDDSINIQELWNARTSYVGDNSAVSKLLGLLPLPSGLLHDHFVLRTAGTERGIEWILKGSGSSSYSIRQLDQNALLLFALIDNLEDFYIIIGNPSEDDTELHYIRSWADEFVGGDVGSYSESTEKLQELLSFPAAKTTSYSIAKLEQGEIVSEYFLEHQDIMDAVIMDGLVKSAVWEGEDISALEECYSIRQTFPIVNETYDYYVYLLEDGRAVLQSGEDGRYSMLSQELYLELGELWNDLTADAWSENQYTEDIPRPDFNNLVWITTDEEDEYCVACYQDVSREQMEAYVQILMDDGWQTVRDLYEDTAAGGLYEKDGRTITIQLSGEQMIMYFSIK